MPFGVGKGSKAALRGSSERVAREHGGAGREQGGSREGAEGVKAAEYGLTRGSLLRLLSSVVVTQLPLKDVSQQLLPKLSHFL